MKRLLLVVIVAILAAMNGPAPAAEVGDTAPDFELTTLDGGTVSLGDIKGQKPLLLVFWATWCPVCKDEVPRLKGLYSDFKGRGLEFLAVNVGVNDSSERARRYVKKYGLDYPVAFDEGSTTTRAFGVLGTPTIVIVDRSGVVRYSSNEVPDDLDAHYYELLR